MNTVTLDNNTYGLAANYANLHNVSISDAVKAGIQMLVGKTNQQSIKNHVRPISELHPSVQALIGIARKDGAPEIKDINGETIIEEYLTEKIQIAIFPNQWFTYLTPKEFLERYF